MEKNTPLNWVSEARKVKDLKVWNDNPRKISKVDLAKLVEKIRERGLHASLVIDTDNTILSGNQRKTALLKLKIEEVNVLVPSRQLTEDEKKKIALESNINDGNWDFEQLKSFDMDLLSEVGFTDLELSNIWVDNFEAEDDNFDVEEELKKIKTPKTRVGDLIILGPHKLICGDSTDSNVVKRLFGKDKASVIYSDPIYNLNIDYNKGIGGKQNYGGNVNDKRSEVEYVEFIKRSLISALSVAKQDVHVFYWNDQTGIWIIQTLYKELGIENKRVCLWIKNGQNPTPGATFNKCYEPCIYGVRGSPYTAPNIQNLNEVMNKEMTTGNSLIEETMDHLDVWAVKRISGPDYDHATQKPPQLHNKAIRRCTRPGDIILDSFMGSGSTLIAAEQLKRRVYGIELEPIFCDLIIRRYEKLAGDKAKVVRVKNEEE